MSFPGFSLEKEEKVVEYISKRVREAQSLTFEEKNRAFEEMVEESLDHRRMSRNKKFLSMILTKLAEHETAQWADLEWSADIRAEVVANLREIKRAEKGLRKASARERKGC